MQNQWAFNVNRDEKTDGVKLVSFKLIGDVKDLPRFSKMQCDEYLHIIFVESGKICVAVDESTYDVGENCVIVYNANVSHKEIAIGGGSVKLWSIRLDGAREDGKPYNHLIGARDLPFVYMEGHKAFKYYLTKLYDELVEQDACYQDAIKCLTEMLYISVKRQLGRERLDVVGSMTETCKKVKDYIDENFNKELRIEDLAAMVYVSTYGLVHQFKRVVKISPIQYQIFVRVNEAKKYLVSTKFSIRDIGEMVGYADGAYFSRIFKKHSGYSPQRYREKFGIGD